VKNLPGGISVYGRTLNRDYLSPDPTMWETGVLNDERW